jgi:hypothetical protein
MILEPISLSSCFYHFNDLVIPPATGDPIRDKGGKCLVGHFQGQGVVDGIVFRTDYYGVWFGCQQDDYPFVVMHNGDCLQNMGLIGAAGASMDCYLPYYNGPDDLAIAFRKPLQFNHRFRLWMGNSHPEQSKKCIGLHVYVTGRFIEPAEGNQLDWTVDLPERHPNTQISGQTIVLQRIDEEGNDQNAS